MKFFGEPVTSTEILIFFLFVVTIAMLLFAVDSYRDAATAARAHPVVSVQCKGPITIERRRDFYEARCTEDLK